MLIKFVYTYNPQETYIYESGSCMGILVAAAFEVQPIYHINKYKIPGQLIFVQDRILPIKHVVQWRYIHQRKQSQI